MSTTMIFGEKKFLTTIFLFFESCVPSYCPSPFPYNKMALFRQVLRAPRILSQCQRLAATAQQQTCRSYGEMAFTFSTPSNVYYRDANIKQVDVPSMSGDFGILADHVPTIAALKPGVVAVTDEKGIVTKYFVSTGSVTVNADSTVQILAEEAYPLDNFDKQAISDNLRKATDELGRAQNAAAKAEAQIAVDCLETLNKVV